VVELLPELGHHLHRRYLVVAPVEPLPLLGLGRHLRRHFRRVVAVAVERTQDQPILVGQPLQDCPIHLASFDAAARHRPPPRH
jgi:hypothetical protein